MVSVTIFRTTYNRYRFFFFNSPKIGTLREQLQPVLQALGQVHLLPPLPAMTPAECPENRTQFTRETLDAFRVEQQQQQQDRDKAARAGFGGFGGGDQQQASAPAPSAAPVAAAAVAASALSTAAGSGDATGAADDAIVPEEMSELENQLAVVQRAKLEFERDGLLTSINHLIDNFDRDLREVRISQAYLLSSTSCLVPCV